MCLQLMQKQGGMRGVWWVERGVNNSLNYVSTIRRSGLQVYFTWLFCQLLRTFLCIFALFVSLRKIVPTNEKNCFKSLNNYIYSVVCCYVTRLNLANRTGGQCLAPHHLYRTALMRNSFLGAACCGNCILSRYMPFVAVFFLFRQNVT